MTQKLRMPFYASLLAIFVLSSCTVKQEDISGTYTIKDLRNSLDTLIILSNGTYVRSLYNQDGQRLLFKNRDKWKSNGSRIQFYNYLPDEDEKHSPEESLGLGTMLCDLPIRNRFGKIAIEAPRMGEDDIFYEKLYAKGFLIISIKKPSYNLASILISQVPTPSSLTTAHYDLDGPLLGGQPIIENMLS